MNFWENLKNEKSSLGKPFTVLAPMANVTDWAFRQIIIETGKPDVFYTEFISSDGIVAVGKEKFKKELYFIENERPIVVQFFTSKPKNMYISAQLAVELGFDGIDINMGCPDKSVEKQGSGAALIKQPDVAVKIIREAVRGAGKIPISVKTRLGYDKPDTDWIKTLLETEISSLAIHGRTRKELSRVPAHWDEIEKVADLGSSYKKIIIGNGDVSSLEDLNKKAKVYGLDGIMVGRGIFDNPWFFSGKKIDDPGLRVKILIKHLQNFEILWGENKNFDTMKRFFKIYINKWPASMGVPASKNLRVEMMKAKNKREALSIIDKYFSNLI